MSGYRQAALCIHGLSPKDQKWILKKLPRQQRLTIKQLLRELNAIGIPADQDWLPKVEQKIKNEKLDKSFDGDSMADIKTVDAAPLQNIKKLLIGESDEMVARILAIRHWKWSEQLMAIFSKQRRNRLDHLIADYKRNELSPDVVRALLNVVVTELDQPNVRLQY